MQLGIEGKVALVTGSSRGLGYGAARALAAEGCQVGLAARGKEALEQAAQRLARETGAQVFARATDLSQAGEPAALAAAVRQELGPVEILVTNAGGPPVGRFDDFGPEHWQRAVELTLFAAQALVREALPGMRERGWGRIINLTSVSVKQPLPGLILSNSVRAAVVGWSKTLADEVGPQGITVNCVLPGWILTERVEQLLAHQSQARGVSREEALAEVEKAIPLGRLGRPEELGSLVAFLASEQASYLTGGSFLIDGGLYRGLM
ncbi:MAG: SDR family oxidoreductase [Deltaproteobacteria bacterium]|nr:SDR family oxidoreductase [Deltaproteobacteria bacterium]